MSKVNEYYYYISSKQRETDSASTSDFNMRVEPNFNLVKSTNYWRVSVLSATIPFSFKQVNIFNNIFYIEYNSNIIPVTLPVGNYNIQDLSTQAAAAIIAAVSVYDTINFTISYNLITGFSTFNYVSSALGFPTIKIFANYTIAEMLGINSDLTITLGGSAVGQIPFNVNPILSLYIRSGNLNQQNNLESLFGKSQQTNILCEILLSENPGSFINWLNSENVGVRITNKTLSTINLYLSSSDDNVLNLQGLNWSCLLLFEEYEPRPIQSDVTLTAIARSSVENIAPTDENPKPTGALPKEDKTEKVEENKQLDELNKKLEELKKKVTNK